MFEVDVFVKEEFNGIKDEEVMFGIVVIKFMLEILLLFGEEFFVELMLFRLVSNVKYKGRFFSEVSFLKLVGNYLKINMEIDMEELVLEVF